MANQRFSICLDFSQLNSAISGLLSEVILRIGMSRTAMNLQKQSSISQFPQNCFKCKKKLLLFALGNILPFVPGSLYILVTWFLVWSYQSQLSCLFVFNNKLTHWLISFDVTWFAIFERPIVLLLRLIYSKSSTYVNSDRKWIGQPLELGILRQFLVIFCQLHQ